MTNTKARADAKQEASPCAAEAQGSGSAPARLPDPS